MRLVAPTSIELHHPGAGIDGETGPGGGKFHNSLLAALLRQFVPGCGSAFGAGLVRE
jgi:hypothetical protein